LVADKAVTDTVHKPQAVMVVQAVVQVQVHLVAAAVAQPLQVKVITAVLMVQTVVNPHQAVVVVTVQ
jgi:hypothetical protein